MINFPATRTAAVIATLIGGLVAGVSGAQDEVRFESTEVVPGLYMLQGVGGFAGGNLALSVGDDGVVIIDDGLGGDLDPKLQAAIDEITTDPVDFVINTHVHGDHVGGNLVMAEQGATIVAHDRLRERMLAESSENGTPPDALPVLTFSDAVTFHLNGIEAHVFHVAAAHTDGDAVVHYRNVNVIHTGDVLFNGLYPFIDLDSGGSVSGYLAAQKKILELADAETQIISGHGPLATRDDVAASISMIEAARAKVASLVQAGHSEDEVVQADPLAEFDADWTWGFINTERMTRTLFRDLKAN